MLVGGTGIDGTVLSLEADGGGGWLESSRSAGISHATDRIRGACVERVREAADAIEAAESNEGRRSATGSSSVSTPSSATRPDADEDADEDGKESGATKRDDGAMDAFHVSCTPSDDRRSR